MKVFAQQPIEIGDLVSGGGLGPAAITYSGPQAFQKITDIVSSIIGILTIAASIWFVFQFMIGGFFWITSGGDKQKLHDARQRINNAFIGLIIVVAGWAILALAGQFLGFDTLAGPGILESIRFR